MKRISLILLLMMLAVFFCSCSPATKSEIMRYVKDEYGESELIEKEEVSEDEIIYHLKDEEYGFEYYVKSSVNDILIDGAKFGESESQSSNFNSKYYEYITEQIQNELSKLEEEYQVDIVTSSENYDSSLITYHTFADVYYLIDDLQTAPKLAKAVNDLYKSYDERNYWKNNITEVYSKYENEIGAYYLEYNMWKPTQTENDYFYILKSKALNGDAVYIRKEDRLFKNTGLSLDDVADVSGEDKPTEDTVVTYYYFDLDGKEFFVADVLLNSDFSYYTNYDEVIKK